VIFAMRRGIWLAAVNVLFVIVVLHVWVLGLRNQYRPMQGILQDPSRYFHGIILWRASNTVDVCQFCDIST
jgi:hypothetical protein